MRTSISPPAARRFAAPLFLLPLTAFVLVLATGVAKADVFHMPDGLTSIEMVTVGNPGNGPDARYSGFGAVASTYQIGKYEVTAGQYVAFLNAVAASDPYGLYNTKMDVDTYERGCQITRHGVVGAYTYDFSGRPGGNESDWVNRPVNYVSWGAAVRFVNWLHNGQPSGTLTGDPSQDAGLTEDGAYYVHGATTDSPLVELSRKPGAKYWLPTDDEWYKAAYHKNDGVTANYWEFPTANDAIPSNTFSSTGTNNANYGEANLGYPHHFTEVGAFAGSPSPYTTFDQGGNVFEWTETQGSGPFRRLRGGSYSSPEYMLRASRRFSNPPTTADHNFGFRVAGAVPEPGSIALLLSCAVAGLIWWQRHR